MDTETPAYGLWAIVFLNAAVFITFAFSFFRPHSKRDWRSFGAFLAFIVALFAKMYGFPLRIYLLSGWLGSRFPNLDVFSHNAGLTLLTLIMFPILVVMYVRLVHLEEREASAECGQAYLDYVASTPAFFPCLGRQKVSQPGHINNSSV